MTFSSSSEMKDNTPNQALRGAEYQRVLKELLTLCEELGIGGRIPRHTELMRRFEGSERNVIRALEEAQRRGRIVRRHGSGTFVTDPADKESLTQDTQGIHVFETQSIVAITRPDSSLFDRCIELLYDKAAALDMELLCRIIGPERDDLVTAGGFGAPRGIVIFRHDLAPLALRLQESGHRVVLIGAPHTGQSFGVPCIYGHQEMGGYMLGKHLIDLGHRHMAYDDRSGSLTEHLRWQGHLRAIREAQRAGDPVTYEILDRQTITNWGKSPQLACEYLRKPGAPTAVIAWNDHEAVEILAILSRAGIAVPAEVSVTGYDNLPEGQRLHPSLTTVDHIVEGQVSAAVDLLMTDASVNPGYTLVFAPVLTIRESTAAPSKLSNSAAI